MSYWTGKVVVVTGASAGLGLHLARAFAAAGATVVMAARDRERLQAAAGSIAPAGRAIAVPADVTSEADVRSLIERATAIAGRLDALVNCAGISSRGRAIDTSPEEFDRLLDVNLLAVVRCTQAAMPHLLRSRGHVVNISSLSGKTASRYLGAYPASKFALSAYTQQLRLEMTAEGVHVLLVSPGPIARDDAGRRYDEQAADLPTSARRPGGGAKIRGLDPARLAQAILAACERRKPELVLPRRARVLFAIQHLSPRLGDWLLRKVT
jgi:NAD(P)-dependent dehydrogenase (short-subunit alcohol dehydrogenase family)